MSYRFLSTNDSKYMDAALDIPAATAVAPATARAATAAAAVAAACSGAAAAGWGNKNPLKIVIELTSSP